MELSSVFLESTCQEWLSEVEFRYPVLWRWSIDNPLLHEIQSLDEVIEVRAEWFQGGVGLLNP